MSFFINVDSFFSPEDELLTNANGVLGPLIIPFQRHLFEPTKEPHLGI